jgi:hypothetical protein
MPLLSKLLTLFLVKILKGNSGNMNYFVKILLAKRVGVVIPELIFLPPSYIHLTVPRLLLDVTILSIAWAYLF